MISPKLLNKIWNNEIDEHLKLDNGSINLEYKSHLAAALRILNRRYFGKNNNTQLIQGFNISDELKASLKDKNNKLSKKEKHLKKNTKFKI